MGFDALLIDPGRFYAELAAMQLGMPYVHISNSLDLDFSGYIPLCLSVAADLIEESLGTTKK
jgi:hypothetical protein